MAKQPMNFEAEAAMYTDTIHSHSEIIKIHGLSVHDEQQNLFKLEGLLGRHIAWSTVFTGLGYQEGDLTEEERDRLAGVIEKAFFKFNIVRILTERIEASN